MFERITHAVVFAGCVVGMVLALYMTCFAATSETQAEALQAERIGETYNPYREIIMNATEEELTELHQVLALEAGIDTVDGRLATLQVILNRVLSTEWPSDIHSVLSQTNPTQYSTYKKRNKAVITEKERAAIAYIINADLKDLPVGFDRVFQDNKPIGKNPIKIGLQYFGQ